MSEENSLKKIISDFRIFALKKNAVKLIVLLLTAAADAGLWFFLSVNASEETVNTLLSIQWLFVSVLTVCGVLFVYTAVTQIIIDPNRLKGHLENLSSDDREQLVSDYNSAGNPENGRFFLSKFMLYFTYGGGIMRYSIIDRISVFPKGLWVESVSRSVLLKTSPKEDKSELMNKLIERTNKERAQDE